MPVHSVTDGTKTWDRVKGPSDLPAGLEIGVERQNWGRWSITEAVLMPIKRR